MFLWMTVLLTVALLPFLLIIGLPVKVTTVRKLTLPEFWEAFPLSSWTPILVLKPHPWFQRFMDRALVGAYAIAGCVVFRGEDTAASTEYHEAIHVAHQSSVSPILYALAYMLDILTYLPFKQWYPKGEYKRIPVAEVIARKVSGRK